MKDELRFHLEAKVDDLVAQGWSPEAARKEAKRQFGDILTVPHVGEHMERCRCLTDIEKKPLQSIGLIAGALVALLFWSLSLLRHTMARL